MKKSVFRINKTFTFDAAHCLNLGNLHKCSRLHGHTYRVDVVCRAARLDENGMVTDFGDFGDVKHFINEYLDHRNLNEILATPTTAEHLAKYIFEWILERHKNLELVRVWETPTNWAEYSKC